MVNVMKKLFFREKYLKIDDGKKQFSGEVTDEIAKELKEIKLSII